MNQIGRVGGMHIFRHALSIRHVLEGEPVSDQHVEHMSRPCRFVDLGDDATREIACRLATGAAVRRHDFIEGFGLCRCIKQQHALHLALRKQHGLLGDALVALSHANGVDEDKTFTSQRVQRLTQIFPIAHRVHHDAQNLCVEA